MLQYYFLGGIIITRVSNVHSLFERRETEALHMKKREREAIIKMVSRIKSERLITRIYKFVLYLYIYEQN